MLWLTALVVAALSVVTRAAEPTIAPVQTEPATGSRITGIVHRPDGKPATGATVQIIGGHSESYKQHQTDPEGRFAIQWHPNPGENGENGSASRLLIRDPERNLAAACELEEGSGPLDLRLEPGLTLVGRAECGGKPLTNATASLLFWTGDKGETLTGLCVGTNTPGRFEIPALPPGRRYGVYVSAPGYGPQYTVSSEVEAADGRVELDPVEFNPANFKPANFKIAGQVVSADGRPVTNANVILRGDSQSNGEVRTDGEGRFRFEHVCEGPVQLFANANAHGTTATKAGDTNVVIKLGKNLTDNTRVVTHQLKGIVTDPNGQPVSGAQVAAGNSGVPHWVETDTNGTYNLTWSYLQQNGSAGLFARHVARNLVVLADLSEETTNFNVQLEPGLIFAGRVESNNGKPIAGAEVGIGLAVSTTTGTDGRFEMKALPALPQYGFLAKAKGHSPSLQLAQARLDTNQIELDPFILKADDQVLSGQVLDQMGKPVSDVTVSFPGENGLPVKATTDRKGRFSFSVCEGTFNLVARGLIGYADASAEAGDTNVIIQLGRYDSSAGVAPRRPTLEGKPLPDLAELGFAANAVPAGKPVLLCLVDVEQRPSRRVARLLAEQHAALRQQGITVLAVQATVASAEAVKEWQGASPVPFPVGRVADTSARTTKWATTVESLPWLILTDNAGRVVAEGFAFDELDSKLKGILK